MTPEVVDLDEWGYPLARDLDAITLARARDAVKACPTLALRLVTR